MYYLGTDANQKGFWIETDLDEVLANLERSPTNKFYLIKDSGPNPVLKRVTLSATKQSRTRSVTVASADGRDLN